MSCLRKCPRCGEHSFENLKTYSHCAGCLYFEDSWRTAETDYYDAVRTLEELSAESESQQKKDDLSDLELVECSQVGA